MHTRLAQLGDAEAIASIYNALAQSPQWPRSLFVVTYDEHGGFYDHVPPPLTEDDDADFRQLGFRVPSLVIGPRVRAAGKIEPDVVHVGVAAVVHHDVVPRILRDLGQVGMPDQRSVRLATQ